MAEAIELENVGPISHLSIPTPDDGGVVVLKGANGSGKSHAIAGIQSLGDKSIRSALQKRDGSIAGTIEGAGVKIRLGRVNTARGELSVTSLESILDPSVLVDPGIKDPSSADAKRLQVVARLAKIEVTRDDWMAILGGFDSLESVGLTSDDLTGDDPVSVADSIRRKLHDSARRIEKEIDGLSARADVAAQDIPSDLPESIDIAAYHTAVADAESRRKTLDADVRRIERADQGRKDALERLAKLKESAKSSASIEAQVDELSQRIGQGEKLLDELKTQVLNLEHALKTDSNRLGELKREQAQAEESEAMIAELEARIAGDSELPPSSDELTAADGAITQAREALSAAILTQQNIERLRKWKSLVEEIDGKRKAADAIRDVARSTDSAIESAFARAGVEGVVIECGRLCVKSDRGGGQEPFSDLSHGERWRWALDIARRGVGDGALLAVAQEAWESLDPDNRRQVASMARERKIVLVTAECSDGDLRAEVFED